MRQIIVLLVLASCSVAPAGEDVRAGIVINSSGCPAGWHVGWGSEGRPACVPTATWPPPATGSRSATSPCTITDGAYDVAWRTDVDEDVRPAFSATRVVLVAQDRLDLDEWPFSLAWTDAGHALAWEPGATDILEFRVESDCDGGLSGWLTAELPYVNPGRQVETWRLAGHKEM